MSTKVVVFLKLFHVLHNYCTLQEHVNIHFVPAISTENCSKLSWQTLRKESHLLTVRCAAVGRSVNRQGVNKRGHGKGHVIDHTKLHGKNKASGIFCAHLSSTWHVQERRVEKCCKTISERAFTYLKNHHILFRRCSNIFQFSASCLFTGSY